MKRKELENRLLQTSRQFELRLREAPLAGFAGGILLGILITALRNVVVWLVFLLATGLAVMWLMAEPEEPASGSGAGGGTPPPPAPPEDKAL